MSYTLREVSTMLGLSTAQIRSYASSGFLNPERGERGELRFGFHDLVILRTAGELAAAQIPPRKVRRVLEKLRDQLPVGRSITGVRIAADGTRIVVRDGDIVWNPESGQELFDFGGARRETLQTTTYPSVPNEIDHDADAWYDIGCDFEDTSVSEAMQAYERAIELNPEHADARVNLGRLLHEQGAPAAAEPHYRAALEADPGHEIAAFNLGVALEDLGRLSEAIDVYKMALRLNPSNADAHYNLAGIFERRGDRATALRHLKSSWRLRNE